MIALTHLILASSSPRRKELLEKLQLKFECIASNIEETFDENALPETIVQELAYQKAKDVHSRMPHACVIGADTIVVLNGIIIGKPKDENDAFHTLKMLSGKTHDVLTGVAIIHPHQEIIFYERTNVTFWELSDEEIYSYIATGEPFDKAGSYGIQNLGSTLVKKINGDYFTVVGLPISRTARTLRNLGILL